MNPNHLIRIVIIACFCGVAGLPAAAARTVPVDSVDVRIVADDGRVFARYDLREQSRSDTLRAYLEAERGEHYAIRIRNRTSGRIGLVIAVDGRNILSGEKSYLRANEPMYVLGAYEQATYAGWRTSDTQVHRFFFTDVESSYADSWGDRSAMGVIAVAAFRELPRPQPRRQLEHRDASPDVAAPESRAGKSAESADMAANAPGTGFGDGRYSRSVRVHFKPQQHPFASHFLKYEWRETLVRLGIIRENPPRNRFWPEHLGRALDDGFAPYPPGYWSRRR